MLRNMECKWPKRQQFIRYVLQEYTRTIKNRLTHIRFNLRVLHSIFPLSYNVILRGTRVQNRPIKMSMYLGKLERKRRNGTNVINVAYVPFRQLGILIQVNSLLSSCRRVPLHFSLSTSFVSKLGNTVMSLKTTDGCDTTKCSGLLDAGHRRRHGDVFFPLQPIFLLQLVQTR